MDALVATALAVGCCLAFADVLFAGRNFYIRDIARTYVPDRRVLFDFLNAGEWPFWNRYLAAGQPLAANPHYHAFYPGHWLGLVLPIRDAFHVGIVLHYPLAATGMYLLLRSLGAGRAAALLAGFAWALGGTLTSLAALVPLLFSASWLPWVLLFFRRYVHGHRARDFALAALSLGMLLLAADVSIILQAGGLTAAIAIAAAWQGRSRPGPGRPLLAAVFLVIVATLLAAVQIIPALDHQLDTLRAKPIPYPMAVQWSFPPARVIELVLPTLFGIASPEAIFFWATDRLGTMQGLPFILSIYCGIPIVALFAAGLVRRVEGSAFFGIVSAISFLLALGENGPLFPLLYQAGLRSLRYPEKFFVTTAFAIVVVAGLAADQAWRDRRVRLAAGIFAAAITLAAAVITLVVSLPSAPELFRAVWLVSDADAVDFSGRFRRSMLGVTAVAAVTTTLFLLERVSLLIRGSLLGALLVVDLASYHQGWIPRIDASYYETPELARRLLAEKRDIRIYSHADYQRRVLPQPPLPIGIRPWVVRNGLLPASNGTWRIGGVAEVDPNLTMLRWTFDFHQIIDAMRRTSREDRLGIVMQMAGVTDMTILQSFDPTIVADPRRFHEIEPVSAVRLDNRGRFYFAERVIAATPSETLRYLLSDERLPATTAFTETATLPTGDATVIRAGERLNSLFVETEVRAPALLVVTATRHKYWTATIDGVQAPIHPVNVAFQGIAVPSGRHLVEMRYRNPLVVRFGYVSLLTIIALIAMVLWPRRPTVMEGQ